MDDLTDLPEKALAFIASYMCGYRSFPTKRPCGTCSPCRAKQLIRSRKSAQGVLF